jgi:hypothetical protein
MGAYVVRKRYQLLANDVAMPHQCSVWRYHNMAKAMLCY